jgi:hypothetical protein
MIAANALARPIPDTAIAGPRGVMRDKADDRQDFDFLSADDQVGFIWLRLGADCRYPLRRVGRPKPQSPSLVSPIVAGQPVETPVWERTRRTLRPRGNLA